MTDKKPNNNDIIKALDICSKSTNGCSHSKYTCEDCYLNGQPMCSSVLLQDAIDLHTRQQAEIENLKNKNFILSRKRANIFEITDAYERGRSETVKKFAERIKELIQTKEFTDDVAMLMCAFVENICKEMVGEDNA